jgi:hypothetical protein
MGVGSGSVSRLLRFGTESLGGVYRMILKAVLNESAVFLFLGKCELVVLRLAQDQAVVDEMVSHGRAREGNPDLAPPLVDCH